MEILNHLHSTLNHTYRWGPLTFFILIVVAFISKKFMPSDQNLNVSKRKTEEVGLVFTAYLVGLFLFEYQYMFSMQPSMSWPSLPVEAKTSTLGNIIIAPALVIMFVTWIEEFVWRGPLFKRVHDRWGSLGLSLLAVAQLIALNWNRTHVMSPIIYSWLRIRTRSFAATWALHSLERLMFYYAFSGPISQHWLLLSLQDHPLILSFLTITFSVAPLWMFFDIQQGVPFRRQTLPYSKDKSVTLETE